MTEFTERGDKRQGAGEKRKKKEKGKIMDFYDVVLIRIICSVNQVSPSLSPRPLQLMTTRVPSFSVGASFSR